MNWVVDISELFEFCCLQTDMTAEEKRKERQRELREEMNREALERLKQAKEKTSKTKSVHFKNCLSECLTKSKIDLLGTFKPSAGVLYTITTLVFKP